MKALVVFEMQNDYLWEKRREKFPYRTAELVESVNNAILQYQAEGCDILYLSQVFEDTPTNHIVFGFCIEKTEGVALYDGLQVVSPYQFEKKVADVLLEPEFTRFIEEKQYDEFVFCGLDENGSIAATAKSLLAQDKKVTILQNCTGSRFPMNKLAPLRAELKSLGCVYQNSNA
ncbi:MAG: isochorismatase family protein [Oscillospiraceae bacterium]|nr:isochorismatase family protein [Oscillospiraceae bacterium]